MSLTYYLYIAAGIIVTLRALLIGIPASTNISRKLNQIIRYINSMSFSDFQRVLIQMNVQPLKCISVVCAFYKSYFH